MKKHRMTTKALSVLLTAIMLFTTISVGIIVPDAKVQANAVEVDSLGTLASAIETANAATGGTVTTIKLKNDITLSISGTSDYVALPAISGKVIFDFNGKNLKIEYYKSSKDDKSIQIPPADNWYSGFTSKAVIKITEKGYLQFINSSDTEGSIKASTRNINEKYNEETHDRASANLILCEGTLVVGDEKSTDLNNFKIQTHASVRCTNGDLSGSAGQKSATVNVCTITLNSGSAVFKMYGGTVQSTSVTRGKRGLGGAASYDVGLHLEMYVLNVENCKSAEIYGGTIEIPSENDTEESTGIYNKGDFPIVKTDGLTVAAVRCDDSDLYIFDADIKVNFNAGRDTADNDDVRVYLSPVYSASEDGAANIYGGNLSYNITSSDDAVPYIEAYLVRDYYRSAVNGVLGFEASVSGSYEHKTYRKTNEKGAVSFCTIFPGTDGTAVKGINLFDYSTFSDYISNYSATSDTTFGKINTYVAGSTNYTMDAGLYKKDTYIHSGWMGKTHPADSYSAGIKDTSSAGFSSTNGGSLFLIPTWSYTNYDIAYDFAIEEGFPGVTNADKMLATYTVEGNMSLVAPTREAYTFGNDGKLWEVVSTSQRPTDSKTTWKPGALYSANNIFNSSTYGDVTLKPLWTPVTYKASIDLDGGSWTNSNGYVNYNIETGVALPTSGITKPHYTPTYKYVVSVNSGSTWALQRIYDATSADNNAKTPGEYGDVTFRMLYTPVSYKVYFDSNGGSAVDDDYLTEYTIETKTSLPLIYKAGQTLVGWYIEEENDNVGWEGGMTTDKDGNVVPKKIYAPDTTFAGKHGEVTLKAWWEESTYTIKADIDGEEKIYNYVYASSFEIPNPVKPGYTFAGWDITRVEEAEGVTWAVNGFIPAAAGSSSVLIEEGNSGNIEVKARFDKDNYTITFDTNGGSIINAASYSVTDSVKLNIIPTKNGYTFTGWTPVSADSHNWTGTDLKGEQAAGLYGNVTLVAGWEYATYNVTLDFNGAQGTNPTAYTYKMNGNTSLPAGPVKTGFIFDGWKITAKSDGASWNVGDVITDAMLKAGNYGDVTLTAQWTHKEYKLEFVGLGTNRGYIDVTTVIPSFSAPGKIFKGWKVVSSLGNWTVGEIFSANYSVDGRYGDTTFEPVLETKSYTIKFMEGSTVVKEEIPYTIDDNFSLPTLTRPGQYLAGWRVIAVDNTDCNWVLGKIYYDLNVAAGALYGNVTLEPVFEANIYKLTFDTLGGSAVNSIDYPTGNVKLPAAPVKTGYTFMGWVVTSENSPDRNWEKGESYAAGEAVSAKYGNATLTADWQINSYTVTWKYPDGDDKVPYTYGQTLVVPKPDNYTKDGYSYTFIKWTPDAAEGVPVTSNATYTAVFAKVPVTYTVTWKYTNAAGVQVSLVETYKAGEKPVFKASDLSCAAGYTFTGWTDGNNTLTDSTVVTADVTYTPVYAQTTEATYKITWKIQTALGANTFDTVYTYVNSGSMPVCPVGLNASYEANGYMNGFTVDKTIVAATENAEYTIRRTATVITYSAQLIANGGTISSSVGNYNVNTGLTLPESVKPGYRFDGWMVIAPDGSWTDAAVHNAGTYSGVYGNVTLLATYTALSYTLELEGMTGNTHPVYTVESTETILEAITDGYESAPISREGYELTGWEIVKAAFGGSWSTGDIVSADALLTGAYGDLTVAPVWTEKVYTITWKSGDSIKTDSVKYGEFIVSRVPDARAGYSAKWDNAVPVQMGTADLTFTAVYTAITYYLRFDAAGGAFAGGNNSYTNLSYAIEAESGEEKSFPVPTRTGASFEGWKCTSGSGSWIKDKIYKATDLIHGNYGDATFVAVWTLKTYTITWHAGDVTTETTWYYGATPVYDGVPYKSPLNTESFVFTGFWSENEDGSAILEKLPAVTGDAEYYAVFTPQTRTYTVTWRDGTRILHTDICTYGDIVTDPTQRGENSIAIPERAETDQFRITFSGWSPAVGEGVEVTGDMTFNATFEYYRKIDAISLDSSAVFMDIGDVAQLTARVYPENASGKDVRWSSSDPDIATVDETGKITARAAGITVICVQSVDGTRRAFCAVSVSAINTNYIVVSAAGISTTRLPGDAIRLYAKVMPENASNRNVVWTSSNPAVATVDSEGLVVFGSTHGTAVITASSDGYASGSLVVTNTTSEEDIEEEVKTYIVMFEASAAQYVIAGNTYDSINVICREGDTVEFLLAQPYFATLNGEQFSRDVDGFYRIKKIDQNYLVYAMERADMGFEEDTGNGSDEKPKESFFDKLKAFFRSIVEFFRNLFN